MLPSGTQAQLTAPHHPKPQPPGSFPSPPCPRLVPGQVHSYLAPSKPSRLGGWKLSASSRWAQPLW